MNCSHCGTKMKMDGLWFDCPECGAHFKIVGFEEDLSPIIQEYKEYEPTKTTPNEIVKILLAQAQKENPDKEITLQDLVPWDVEEGAIKWREQKTMVPSFMYDELKKED